MPEVVYILGSLCSLLCAVLLLRQYLVTHQKLLLWSTLSFVGLTATNVLVFLDVIAMPEVDLQIVRWMVTSVSLAILLFGLIWESK